VTLQELPIAAKDDALTLLCGELLGAGASRHVYTYVPNPTDTVIKVEMERRWFQNVKEWMVWEAVRHVDHARPWFAPAIRISEFGVFMLQERTRPVTLAELRKELPRVPAFFTDLKVGNWGRVGKRIVCHDYGTCLTVENGLTRRMKRADWWEN
jgi:hypothetical protein